MSHYFNNHILNSIKRFSVWKSNTRIKAAKRVLVIDDICDTGDTFKKLKEELSEALPDLMPSLLVYTNHSKI